MTAPLIVATGANGQLGQTLSRLWSESPLPDFGFLALDRNACDLSDPVSTTSILAELRPAYIINAAAYTQVDRAESDRDAAFLINDAAAETLSRWAADNDASLIHISTDFVFDGAAKNPYRVDQPTQALGAYGASKLEGEQKVLGLAQTNSAIVRTSWLYSEYGNNFVKTMLRLMGEREQLSVVNDQIGSPTSTQGLAEVIFAMIERGGYEGVYHWTDGGSISWYDFAVEIQAQAVAKGLLTKAIPIRPIATSDYPTPAKRPSYSVLDRSRVIEQFACPTQDWKSQLGRVLNAIKALP